MRPTSRRQGCERIGYPNGCAIETDGGEMDKSACNTDGFGFTWAEHGTCALTQNGGRVTNATLCTMKGGSYKMRATSAEECSGHGQVCSSQFNMHDVYGGITDETTCTECGYKFRDNKRCA